MANVMPSMPPINFTEKLMNMTSYNTTSAKMVPRSSTLFTAVTARPAEPEERVAGIMWVYLPPILWAIGSVGNVISIIVFSRKGISESTTAFFFRTLAIFDLLALQVVFLSCYFYFIVLVPCIMSDRLTC